MKSKLILSLIVLLFLSACKKKNEDTVISLKGKWTAENMVYKHYDKNVIVGTYTDPTIGTTLDFQSNGTLVINEPLGISSISYSIKPDSKVEFNGDVYEIRNLTASSVTLFIREDFAPGEYTELFHNLKR